jgi:hypothetical protein
MIHNQDKKLYFLVFYCCALKASTPLRCKPEFAAYISPVHLRSLISFLHLSQNGFHSKENSHAGYSDNRSHYSSGGMDD